MGIHPNGKGVNVAKLAILPEHGIEDELQYVVVEPVEALKGLEPIYTLPEEQVWTKFNGTARMYPGEKTPVTVATYLPGSMLVLDKVRQATDDGGISMITDKAKAIANDLFNGDEVVFAYDILNDTPDHMWQVAYLMAKKSSAEEYIGKLEEFDMKPSMITNPEVIDLRKAYAVHDALGFNPAANLCYFALTHENDRLNLADKLHLLD